MISAWSERQRTRLVSRWAGWLGLQIQAPETPRPRNGPLPDNPTHTHTTSILTHFRDLKSTGTTRSLSVLTATKRPHSQRPAHHSNSHLPASRTSRPFYSSAPSYHWDRIPVSIRSVSSATKKHARLRPSCPLSPLEGPATHARSNGFSITMSAGRPSIVGDDAGPSPPYPLKMEGKVISGFGRGSKEASHPILDAHGVLSTH